MRSTTAVDTQQVDELGPLGLQHLVPQVAVDEPVRTRRTGELADRPRRACGGRLERTASAASWSAAAHPPDHSAAAVRSSGGGVRAQAGQHLEILVLGELQVVEADVDQLTRTPAAGRPAGRGAGG